jgi:hypothetical protein
MSGHTTLTKLVPWVAPAPPPQRVPQTESVAALARDMQHTCAAAVDSLEIAARLEADGINDNVASVKYGHRDVFSLADQLFSGSFLDPGERPTVPEVWRSNAVHHVLRGVLFGLPGLLYLVASQHVGGGPATTGTIVLSLLTAWAASEALSYLGYLRIGRADRPGAARILRRGMLAVLAVLLPLTGGVAASLHVAPIPMVFALAQAVYLVTATVVLVTGGEWWLLVALTPGVSGAIAFLTSGALAAGPAGVTAQLKGPIPMWVWACSLGTVAATAILAFARSYGGRRAKGRTITLADLAGAVPHALFGLVTGALLTFGTIVAILGAGSPAGSAALVALPLSLSMGIAEWLLFAYRRRAHKLLQRTATLRGFRVRSRLTLLAATLAYLVLLAAIAGCLGGLAIRLGLDVTPRLFFSALALGAALFAALSLRSAGVTIPVIAVSAAALAAEGGVLAGAAWLGYAIPADLAQLAASGVLGIALLVHACQALGLATRHR